MSSSSQIDETVKWQNEMLFGNKKNKKDETDVVDESSTMWSVSATDNPDFIQPPEVLNLQTHSSPACLKLLVFTD